VGSLFGARGPGGMREGGALAGANDVATLGSGNISSGTKTVVADVERCLVSSPNTCRASGVYGVTAGSMEQTLEALRVWKWCDRMGLGVSLESSCLPNCTADLTEKEWLGLQDILERNFRSCEEPGFKCAC